jgi:hypothetical protein
MFKELPSQEYLNECLDLDRDTGALTWKERPLRHFASDHAGRVWNAKYPGKQAFCASDADGYRKGQVAGESYLAHRVIWRMVFGGDVGEIDHIDGDPANNSIANLRVVTHQENARNTKVRADSRSGVPGVSFHKSKQRWKVRIWTGGTCVNVGTYAGFDDAVAARAQAQSALGFHENHGARK